ncbi:MAG: DHH family phosphoesterase [Bacteroidetes bacterium MED-G17]|nr:MAG: hypothetical protein CBB99_03135 [Bacteroidetes bacterium TMED39]PDH51512.1 MAG: DHH family phosphoesterase [Bacteroidetes bacterium MED-G17]CAI8341153.1 MAG: putative bifunctional oligoribonuclease and PAP phosphatase NrnA [Bacteroidetes bacterium MED-G17]|tara:strand:- start:13670 stop:14680 length:1011 start_codon:yes stop_codon:yes gene_type:complete
MLENTCQKLWPLLNKEVSLVITTHHKPDGDALGSSLGLYHFFKSKGWQVTVVSPTDYSSNFNWMPGQQEIVNYDVNPEKAKEFVENADILFCLDFNNLSRINDLSALAKNSKSKKVMIDHHEYPEGFDDFRFWNPKASSTAELIYQFVATFDHENWMNLEAAKCLYVGIMTDTGSFRHDSTTAITHLVAKKVHDLGIQTSKIHELVFDRGKLSRTRLVGYVLYHKLAVMEDMPVAITALDKNELKQFNVQTGDTEGFANFGLGIDGVLLSALFVERQDMVKISFRTKSGFKVNLFSQKYFEGGGHQKAAGGRSKMGLEETIEKFKQKIREHKDELF